MVRSTGNLSSFNKSTQMFLFHYWRLCCHRVTWGKAVPVGETAILDMTDSRKPKTNRTMLQKNILLINVLAAFYERMKYENNNIMCNILTSP